MTSESRATGDSQASSPPPPAAESPGLRLSDAERAAVSRALSVHGELGRLGPAELEDRQVLAARATTWSEVTPLFADLPKPHPQPGEALEPVFDPSLEPVNREPVAGERRRGLPVVPHSSRKPILALTSFAALIVFMRTDDWLWFLAIPIVKVLITWGEDDD